MKTINASSRDGGKYFFVTFCTNCGTQDIYVKIDKGVPVQDALKWVNCPTCGCPELEKTWNKHGRRVY